MLKGALFLSLLWATTRFGVCGECVSALALAISVTYGLVNRGDTFDVASSAHHGILPLLFLVGACIALLIVAVALHKRMSKNRASATNEAKFRTVFTYNIVPTFIWDSDGVISDANESFYAVTGYDRADIQSGKVRTSSLLAPSSNASVHEPRLSEVNEMIASGACERVLQRRDRKHVPVLFAAHRFPGASAEGTGYFLDLSSLRCAEAGRARAETLHAAVMMSFHDQIVVLDQAGIVIDANPAWCRLAEQPENPQYERARVGDSYTLACETAAQFGDAFAAELLGSILDILAGISSRRHLEFSRNTQAGMLWYEISVEPLRRTERGVIIVRTDITARKRTAAQVQEQKQQLTLLGRAAVLGELSGAFAHELVQPLTSILGNAEAALQICSRIDGQTELEEILCDIINDDVRAAEVIKRLRSMLSRGEIQRQAVDLNQVVRDVLVLANSDLITRNVAVSLLLEPRSAPVLADPVQLQQVLLNLIVNACEAMSGIPREDRRLTISARVIDDGRAVECAVGDRGSGLASGDLERIFTPFFTTKKRGLGLGLTICRSIVEAHGGRLWAENAPDRGAIFRFTVGTGV